MRNKEFYNDYMRTFLELNAALNLISKNDEKFLWEKHVVDSLSIEKFFEKYYPLPLQEDKISTQNTGIKKSGEGINVLDIGTGGGFPAVPIAITYPDLTVTALDSIRKKINALENIKQKLNIMNLTPVCERAEKLTEKFDIITSRAVASLDKICLYALPLLKKNGYFIAYKSKKTPEEILDADKVLKKYNAKVIDIIEYQLPLKENFTRNLIIIKI